MPLKCAASYWKEAYLDFTFTLSIVKLSPRAFSATWDSLMTLHPPLPSSATQSLRIKMESRTPQTRLPILLHRPPPPPPLPPLDSSPGRSPPPISVSRRMFVLFSGPTVTRPTLREHWSGMISPMDVGVILVLLLLENSPTTTCSCIKEPSSLPSAAHFGVKRLPILLMRDEHLLNS